MRTHILLLALVAALIAPALVDGQGFYRNTMRRNPYTGRWEVVPTGQVDTRSFGPYRNQRTFYGESFNPYNGTLSRSIVQRNPYTGRLEVQNDYFNPYTGGRLTQGTRYNPITRRYETLNVVEPPTNPIPNGQTAQQPPVEQPSTEEGAPVERTTAKPIVKPKIIENTFPADPPPPR